VIKSEIGNADQVLWQARLTALWTLGFDAEGGVDADPAEQVTALGRSGFGPWSIAENAHFRVVFLTGGFLVAFFLRVFRLWNMFLFPLFQLLLVLSVTEIECFCNSKQQHSN